MKKIFVMLLMAVAFCGSAEAQKGMMGVGVNGGIIFVEDVAPGVGAKFQYNITNIFRLEASFTYCFREEKSEGLEFAGLVNAHVFFISPRRIRPYFLAGIGYSATKDRHSHYGYYYSYSYSETNGGFAFNGGLGLDWRLSHKISLQVEAGALKQVGLEEGWALKANVGVAFNF